MTHLTNTKFLIIGSGPAGLGAAQEISKRGEEYTLLEKQGRPIGRCKSHDFHGVIFDEGPHISFTKSPVVKDLFYKNAEGKVNTIAPRMTNVWNGIQIPHPVQSHLAYLPESLSKKILIEMKAIYNNTEFKGQHFEDWLKAHFGVTFFEEFPAKYTRKYWTTDAKNMTTDWVSDRFHRPPFDVIEAGAKTKIERVDDHYFTEFRYPSQGGYQTFLQPLADSAAQHTRLSASVTAIHPKQKWLEVNGSERIHYEHLLCSIPLDLVPSLLVDAPQEVVRAASELRCSSATLYNIIYRSSTPVEHHWGYVYDEDVCFARYSFPKLLVRQGHDPVQAVQAEVYSSAYRAKDPRFDHLDEAIKGFEKVGLFKKSDVIDVQIQTLQHANVIFDHSRSKARETVLNYLVAHQIHGIGRYGSWRYLWSDESFLDGQTTVSKILRKES